MADDMANNGTVVTDAITLDVIAGLDPASNSFKNVFDEDRTVIPGHAKHEPGISRFPDVQLHILGLVLRTIPE
jgi:hypothetical protein